MLPAAITRAKLTVVAFVLITLVYGSVCSAICALGACPTDARNAATHDCDHNASVPAHRPTPQNPDCPKHHHPTFDAVKTDTLGQSQLTGTNHANPNQMLAVTTLGDSIDVSSFASLSDLAPPPNLNFASHQNISVLRV
ncbi:MAG: hypothetical protein WAN72_21240 [Candidatus Acidiferrales bacterium]